MWGVIGFLLGTGVGFLVAYLVVFRDEQAGRLREELARLKAQFEAYQGKVDDHFVKSSELFQQMTERYRDIYQHLASGAQSLCSDGLVTQRLTVPESGPFVEHRSAELQPSEAPAAGAQELEGRPEEARETTPPPAAEQEAAQKKTSPALEGDEAEMESAAPRPEVAQLHEQRRAAQEPQDTATQGPDRAEATQAAEATEAGEARETEQTAQAVQGPEEEQRAGASKG